MLSGRHDIIGDLARLRNEFIGSADKGDDLLTRLELLAAAAVELGMSESIVSKASGVPAGRIGAVLETQPTEVASRAADYERHRSGIVKRRDRSNDPPGDR